MTFLKNSIETFLDKWKRVKNHDFAHQENNLVSKYRKKRTRKKENENAPKFPDRNMILSNIVLIL